MKKVLIFIVAYNAEKTIASVLSRIPVEKLPSGVEVLVIDDSSSDSTFETAQRNRDRISGLPLRVLQTPENQGYGGNQKIGYEYAIEQRYDVVVLLHGDGQYAPEKLPELIAPVLSDEADACFGSRMMEPGAALAKGMPLYKYVGNKILTAFQNFVLGMRLSEFHSGYRAYSVEALKRVPFKYNTNDFHFDTEIIIQFHLAGFRIKETAIPTYYGDEICYVNGIAYAWNVAKATIGSRLHNMGLFFKRQFDIRSGGPAYDAKLGYQSSHTAAISAVAPNSSVLDLSCSYGFLAAELKKKGCRITGVDRLEAVDEGVFEEFICHDLNSAQLPAALGTYDYVLALDCLEHLDSAESLLEKLRDKCYSGRTRLIMTVPNVGFFMVRFGLLLGQFNYGRWGILDLTHRRLFTFSSFRRMLEQEGYVVTRVKGIPAPFPKALRNRALGNLLLAVNRALMPFWKGMFGYQIYVEARFTCPLDRLLAQTIEGGESSSPE